VFECTLGDMITFQSYNQTHFNLHITGIWASLVLHSDREGDKWSDNYNRWGDRLHFKHHVTVRLVCDILISLKPFMPSYKTRCCLSFQRKYDV
jgi:hypothetical protein